jgi:hypothetical protein
MGEPLEQLNRDGEILFVLPDGTRHERRVQRALLSKQDRLFWVTLAIACGSAGQGSSRSDTLARKYGRLRLARNDLEALYEYYRPMQIGDPHTVPIVPGLGKSPGYFDRAISLDNPTYKEVEFGVSKLREWLDDNQEDPEYTSFQFNLFFSGHGDVGKNDCASIVLADTTLSAREFASYLLGVIPANETKPAVSRLDLYLDCCHSARLAAELGDALVDLQDFDRPDRSTITIGQVYCACMSDEESYELDEVGHGIFTFAFLNECSRRQPEGANAYNIALRDVGWRTRGLQHPILIDFTTKGSPSVKFPSLYHVSEPAKNAAWHRFWTLAGQSDSNNWVRSYVEQSQILRDACADAEKDLWRGNTSSVPFSRNEIFTNQLFPFL